jgi:surfeit locus 1 family protein
VQIRIAVGQRLFAPSWLMTGLTLVLLVLFIGLGRWQWGRAEDKSVLLTQFERGAGAGVLLADRATTGLPRYTRVVASGEWEPTRQFLLDNRTRDGRAGYEVLTPLRLPDGRWLLVNRGWVAFTGYRDRLPDVATGLESRPDGVPARVTGRLDHLPSAGLEGGRAGPGMQGSWPRVTSYPSPEQLARALASAQEPLPRVESQVLLLDDDQPQGYLRGWKPLGRGPEQNWSYAIQWWSFAVLLLILYVALNLEKKAGMR